MLSLYLVLMKFMITGTVENTVIETVSAFSRHAACMKIVYKI
jgi:hypothetical protein